MPDGNGFFPPVQYNGIWVLLGILMLLFVIAWFVLVPILTRPKRLPPPENEPFTAPPTPAVLRDRYLGMIDVVESSHARGELSTRVAIQRISVVLRFYAWEKSGVPAPQMTLAELQSSNLRNVSWAVERLYPAAFGPSGPASVAQAVSHARQVVSAWN